jgi:hypothetical protein
MKELLIKGLKNGVVVGVAIVTAGAVMAIADLPKNTLKVLRERKLQKKTQKDSKDNA